MCGGSGGVILSENVDDMPVFCLQPLLPQVLALLLGETDVDNDDCRLAFIL